MLPTFVIGLREGLEASLIVGIIAAFLKKQERTDALRWMWLGVAGAVVLCIGVAIGLHILNQELPESQQRVLESGIALIAVGMVSFMIVWMKRNARHLAGDLRTTAAAALAQGSVFALVGMAFLAVLREGFETAFFLVAAFRISNSSGASAIGASLGIALAVGIGFGIYRGGVHLNLARFFKITSAVLVLVAAGLVASAIGVGYESPWYTAFQAQAFDLTWLIHPNSISESLLTGMLGLSPNPAEGQVIGWAIYAVPMLAYVLWPGRKRPGAATPA